MDIVRRRPEPDLAIIDVRRAGASPCAIARRATAEAPTVCSCPATRRTWRASRRGRSTIIARRRARLPAARLFGNGPVARAPLPTARSTAGSTKCSPRSTRSVGTAACWWARRWAGGLRSTPRCAGPAASRPCSGSPPRPTFTDWGFADADEKVELLRDGRVERASPRRLSVVAHSRLLAIGTGDAAARRTDRAVDPGAPGPRRRRWRSSQRDRAAAVRSARIE